LSTSSLRVAIFGLCGLLALSGCDRGGGGDGSAGADVPEAEKFGGTAVVASFTELQSMNSLVSSDNTTNEIQRQVLFMPLVKYNEEIEPIPWLAERWDTVRVAPDTLELTFHLRKDIKWHDGQPTTAEDVLFTFDRAIDPKTAFPNASTFDPYARTGELVDPYTVKFRLKPHSDFLDIWYMTPVMPKHILGDVPPEQLLTHPFGTQNPVGNGPFRFVRRTPGQEWVFEANPDFPQALGGRPYLDRLVYRNIPEQTTLLTEILTGGIDVYLQPNPNQADQIKAAADVELLASPFRQWNYIAWNTRLPMFSDARVRRALTMAIDRQGIVDALVYGYGDVGRSTITPAHWSYDPNDPQTILPYDTAAARRLLAEAGWMDRNNNGILENEQGKEFRFTLKTNQGNDLRKDITEIVQAQLRPLGIVVEPRLVEWNTLISQLQGRSVGGAQRQRDFEAVVSGWVDYFRKDDTDILHSKNLNSPFQYVQYSNTRADQLIDTLGVMMDRQQAMPLWKEYQHLMVQESPYTPIYYPQRLVAVRRRMQGVETDIRGDFPTVAKWWILPSQRSAARQGAGGGSPPPATDTAAAR
jgi:peptide/nickel transport system substrate-binding protein